MNRHWQETNFTSRCYVCFLVSVYKSKHVIRSKVCDYSTPPQLDYGSIMSTDTNHPLFIGGYPPTLATTTGFNTDHYIGCMSKVEINKQEQKKFVIFYTVWKCYI